MKSYCSRVSLFIIIAFLWTSGSLYAQTDKYTVEADFTAGFSVLNFKDNELVAPKRRNKTGWGDEVIVNTYFLFATKKPGLMIKTGLGYAERNIYMNKTGLGDFIVGLFSFGSADRDSFKLRRVKLQSRYINIPAGFSYDLARNSKNRARFYAGIQLNAGFTMSKKAIIEFDESYLNPSPAERAETERMYETTVPGFSLGIQPRIDLAIRIYKGAGIKLGVMPFMFYVNSWNKELATNHASFASVMGLYYKF